MHNNCVFKGPVMNSLNNLLSKSLSELLCVLSELQPAQFSLLIWKYVVPDLRPTHQAREFGWTS